MQKNFIPISNLAVRYSMNVLYVIIAPIIHAFDLSYGRELKMGPKKSVWGKGHHLEFCNLY